MVLTVVVFFSTDGQNVYGYQLLPPSRRLVPFLYEADFIQGLRKKKEKKPALAFNFTFRYA